MKRFFYLHLIAIALCSSFFFIKPLWNFLDTYFFLLLNSSLKYGPMQLFWACFNHNLADWLEDFIFLGFIIAAVRHSIDKRKTSKQFLLAIVSIAFTILFINKGLFHDVIRPSPTHLFPDCYRLSQQIPWMKIKDSTLRSFPGDHALTAILFAMSYFYLAPRKFAIPLCCYAAFITLPRLVTGAHWLSDVVVGSGSIALIMFAWTFHLKDIYETITSLFMRRTLSHRKRAP